jgi:hypothetical protein
MPRNLDLRIALVMTVLFLVHKSAGSSDHRIADPSCRAGSGSVASGPAHDSGASDGSSSPSALAWPIGTPEAHKHEPHILASADATLTMLPDGMVHIVEPMCRDGSPQPSVLWFCMQSSASCNPCPFAPYLLPYTPPSTPPMGYPNPNLPSPVNTIHPNVARHWRSPPTYYVNIPGGAANSNMDIFNFAGAPLGGPYTYGEFAWEVAYSLAKYGSAQNTAGSPVLPPPGTLPPHPCNPTMPPVMGSVNTSIYAIFGGITSATYGTPLVQPSMTGLLWTTANGGPTGDGVSEFLFSRANLPGGGLTSMIMNPAKGWILECDVLFGAGTSGQWPSRLGGTGCPSSLPCLVGGPGWTTAIPHEVGHFFGSDHTNLHSGHAPGGPSACFPANGPGNPPTLNAAPASLSSFSSFATYPEMAAVITWVNYWRTDPNSLSNSHMDEASGMAELYPIPSPGPQGSSPQALPAINTHGRIEGNVAYNPTPGTTQLLFGANVLPIQLNTGTAFVGRISGTGRLHPHVGIVGAINTAMGIQTSGEFRIERVGGSSSGRPFKLVVEPLGSLGIETLPSPSFAFSEWFYDPGFNPTINTLVCPNIQHSLIPNGLTYPNINTGSPYGAPGTLSLGSLFVAPGTVLQLNLNMSNGLNLPEPVSRPVVTIDQRTGRPVPFNAAQQIVATVIHDYELDQSTGLWTVNNGAPFASGAISTNQPGSPTAPGPWTTSWTTTLGALGIGPTGIAVLRFTASEFPTTVGNSSHPPVGTTATIGINEVIL